MSNNQSETLESLQKRRLALEKLIAVTNDLEQMKNGLNSVLLLDNISYNIPDEIQNFLTMLSEQMKDSPTDMVKEVLRSLDHKVLKSLSQVFNKTLIEISQDEIEEKQIDFSDDLSSEIEEFKKDSQTAIGLRLLLKERGQPIPPFRCIVPMNSIKDRIVTLKMKEKVYRNNITSEIDDMLKNFSFLMVDTNLSDQIRSQIQTVIDDLLTKKNHIKSGKELTDMSMIVESVELVSEKEQINENIQTKKPKPEVQHASKKKKSVKKPNNFFTRIKLWTNTSWKVSWKDTKYYSEKN